MQWAEGISTRVGRVCHASSPGFIQNSRTPSKEKGWKPTPVQEHVLPDVMEGHDRLIIAPTGSGKTMAGILPLFHRCLTASWPSMSILYITPFGH